MKAQAILVTCVGIGCAVLAGCGVDESDPLSGQASALNARVESASAAGGRTFGHDEIDITPQQARMQWLRNDSAGAEPAAPQTEAAP